MCARATATLCPLQEMIVRDSTSGWDLGPELDHFSSRTRQVLQYMNPNKINMDLLVELIAYVGTPKRSAPRRSWRDSVELNHSVSAFCQKSLRSLRRWTAPFLFFCLVWLTSSSSLTCFPRTRGSETETGEGPVYTFNNNPVSGLFNSKAMHTMLI